MAKKRGQAKKRAQAEQRAPTQVLFKYGELLPARCPLAVFIATLAMIVNDQTLVYPQLNKAIETDAPIHQKLYLARLVSGHVYEAAVYLSATRKAFAEVRTFLDQHLAPERHAKLQAVLALVDQKPEHPAKAPMKRARDMLFHYPVLNREAVKRGAEELQGALGRLEDDNGEVVLSGRRLVETRWLFADELALNMIFVTKPTATPAALSDYLGHLSKLAYNVAKVGDEAITAYIASKGELEDLEESQPPP